MHESRLDLYGCECVYSIHYHYVDPMAHDSIHVASIFTSKQNSTKKVCCQGVTVISPEKLMLCARTLLKFSRGHRER